MSIDYNSCIDNLNYDATQKTVFLKEYVRTGRYTIAELQIAQITDDLDAIGKATLLGDNERRQICDTLKLLRESVGGITTNHEKISALFQGLVAKIKSLESSLDPEITAKSGYLWDCVGREPFLNGNPGYVYIFKYKFEVTDKSTVVDLSKKNFPAIELSASELIEFVERSKEHPKLDLILKVLGVRIEANSDGSFYLYLPDREALKTLWEDFRKYGSNSENFPPMDIISSEGIADHLPFIEAYIEHDGLFSSGKEFVHDFFIHILPLGVRIVSAALPNDSDYGSDFHNRNGVKQLYDNIMITKKHIKEQTLDLPEDKKTLVITHIDKIVASLGAVVDTQSSFPDIIEEPSLVEMCESMCYEPEWDVYFKKQFADMPDLAILKEVHDLINRVGKSGK